MATPANLCGSFNCCKASWIGVTECARKWRRIAMKYWGMGMAKEHLTLKWGSLKDWCFESPKAQALVDEWASHGRCLSAALHHDSPEQKRIICELIDIGDFDTVLLDWPNKWVSKEEAKKYVMEYGFND